MWDFDLEVVIVIVGLQESACFLVTSKSYRLYSFPKKLSKKKKTNRYWEIIIKKFGNLEKISALTSSSEGKF